MDDIDRPPAGTECRRCRKFYQHFCPAKAYDGDSPLCLDCIAKRLCPTTEAIQLRLGKETETVWSESSYAVSPGRSVPLSKATPQTEPQPSAWSIKTQLDEKNLRTAKVGNRRVALARPSAPTKAREKSRKLVEEALRLRTAGMSQRAVAEQLGKSQQWVSKLAKSQAPKEAPKPTPAPVARAIVPPPALIMPARRINHPRRPRIEVRCSYVGCDRLFTTPPSIERKYCSRECRKKDKVLQAVCGWCKQPFEYYRSNQRKFCTDVCAKAHQQRKYPAAEIIHLYVEERWSSVRIARRMGTDASVILNILHRNGVEVRKMNASATSFCIEPGCKEPAFKLRHTGNGAMYGTRCKHHRTQHYNSLNKWIRRRTHGIPPDQWLDLADRAWAQLSPAMKEKLLSIAMEELDPASHGFIPKTVVA